jgi:hypothetical protein
MSTGLVDALAINESDIWRGGHRLLLGDLSTPPSFPSKIEDVINPTTYVLAAGWTDIGATTEDGFRLTPEWDTVDGVPIDQRDTPLFGGNINNIRINGTATAMYTDLATLRVTWAIVGASSAIAAGAGTVAQHVAPIGEVSSLPERMVAIVQEHEKTGKLRVVAFRRAKLSSPGELPFSSREVSRNEFTLTFLPDNAITDGSSFGKIFEED